MVIANGKQFDKDKIRDLYSQYRMLVRYASVAHPMTNGQAEVTNRTIIQHLKTMLDAANVAWVDELPAVLWSYKTTPRRAMGQSLFELAFNVEAVVLVEIEASSHIVHNYNEQGNDEGIREELDLLEEVRDNAEIKNCHYQQAMTKYHNALAKPRRFEVGDLMLRKNQFVRQSSYTKLSPNWEGPYIVYEEVYPDTYKIQNSEGKILSRTWNIKHLKKFYQ